MTVGALPWFRVYRVHLFLLLLLSTLALAQSGGVSVSRQLKNIPRAKSTTSDPEQVLYSFQGGNDGADPSGGLIFDSEGNLYGTTQWGGGGPCSGEPAPNGVYSGCGTVFKLSPNGSGGWTETVLYRFQGGTDGIQPSSGLIFDQTGNLYGTTASGGGPSSCCGTVFELSPNGNGGWTEAVLYVFGTNGGSSDGANPQGVIFDKAGNLYGTTSQGGNGVCSHDGFASCGTVFELSPKSAGGWTETIIYKFPSGDSEGYVPNPGLIFDQAGNLYGMTSLGGAGTCEGAGGCGVAFELSPSAGGSWIEMLLYSFQGGSDGDTPLAGLISDQTGNLYGTTSSGGTCAFDPIDGCGTAFKLSPNGSGGWTETILHNFQGSDGARPFDVLIFDKSGNLYSTTGNGGKGNCPLYNGCGTVFELSPTGAGAWAETLLYSFQAGNDGEGANEPTGGVIFDQAGNLYGTTQLGGGTGCGGSGCGVAFEVIKAPGATLSPASISFGNQTPGSASSPQAVTLTNTGRLPLVITLIQITGTNSSDFAQTNTCPASLPQNDSCDINVTFTPTAGGNRSAQLQATDNAPGSQQSIVLTGTGSDFSLAASPAQTTVTPGQAANYTLTVSPVNGFAQKVALSCSGAPPQSTCTISPSSVALDGTGSASASVAVVTSGPSAVLGRPAAFPPPGDSRFALWLAFSGLPGLVVLRTSLCRRRDKAVLGLLLVFVLFVVIGLPGCGGGNGSSGGTTGTPAGTYNLTVTGTFSSGPANLVHSTNFTVVVQ